MCLIYSSAQYEEGAFFCLSATTLKLQYVTYCIEIIKTNREINKRGDTMTTEDTAETWEEITNNAVTVNDNGDFVV